MQVDVRLEFSEGRVIAFVEDSAGIFGSILESSMAEDRLLSSIRARGEQPFVRLEMPTLVSDLQNLMPAASSDAGRRHLQQIVELATRCTADRSMQLLFVPREAQTAERSGRSSL